MPVPKPAAAASSMIVDGVAVRARRRADAARARHDAARHRRRRVRGVGDVLGHARVFFDDGLHLHAAAAGIVSSVSRPVQPTR